MQRVVTEAAETHALFGGACGFADLISLCLARADLAKGGLEAWRMLVPHLAKVDRAIVNLDGGSTDPLLLQRLNELGLLRIAPGPAVMNANLYLFRRGSEARALLGSLDFTRQAFERSVNATVYAQGDIDDDFFCGIRRLLDRCSGLAQLPTRQDIDDYTRTWRPEASLLPAPPTAVAAIPIHERLKFIDDEAGVTSCVRSLAASLGFALPDDRPSVDNSDSPATVQCNSSCWTLRFIADHLRDTELNVPRAIPNRACEGAFAAGEETGHRYFVYHPRFRHHPLVAEQLFWSSTRYRPVEVPAAGDVEGTRVAVVCQLDTIEVLAHLRGLVAELRRVREQTDDAAPGEEGQADDSFDFLSEDIDTQSELAWDILLGAGPLEREDAVRVVANTLRDNKQVAFSRLDKSGRVYLSIESAIEAGFKEGRFDKPRRGYVRALAEELSVDDWRHCLLSTLTEAPMDRPGAIRATAEYAAEAFGIQFERLRRGGRIENSVKSAINSCLRRGLVKTVGPNLITRSSGVP